VSFVLWLLVAPSLRYFRSPVASHHSRAVGLLVVALSAWALWTGPWDRRSNSSSANAVRRLVDPLKDFLHTEAAGGLFLLAATVVALGWANRPPGRRLRGVVVWELTMPLSVTEGPPALGQRRSHGRVLLRGRPGDQLVIPLFALANAGMPMGGGARGRAAHNLVA
jgi:Na+/H+ antiporter NhaA